MVDITHKVTTLREATAEAIVKTSSQATIDAIQNNEVPKGNVFEMAKAAGLLGVKKTPDDLTPGAEKCGVLSERRLTDSLGYCECTKI